MMSVIWAFLIYWLVIFVACFVVAEVGQDQLYDEVTPRVGLKVGSASFLIAAVLTTLRYFGVPASFESMFTTNIAWTLLQGIVWFGVFTLILQFHPWHALGLGIATMLLVSGLATMGVESILAPPSARTAAGRAFSPTRPFGNRFRRQGHLLKRRLRKRQNECVPEVRRGRNVRYITHQFSHVETLERARRWLAQAGIDPSRIETHAHGIPRISVAVEGAEAAEVQLVIDAAESSDPDGAPGIWDLARQKHIERQGVEQTAAPVTAAQSESFVVGWRPQDAEREITQTDTEIQLQRDFRDGKD